MERDATMLKLNDEQRHSWVTNGYIHLEQILAPDEVAFLIRQVDELRQKPGYETADIMGHFHPVEHARNLDPEGFLNRRNLLEYHDEFIALIDRSPVFDYIVDIMGPYIAYSMSQAIVRHTDPDYLGYTHTDGGEALRMIRVSESSKPLAVKVLYLLTDVLEPDSGNFTVFPGSHMRPFPPPDKPSITPYSPGSAQLMGKAGDCIIFTHSLWHGPARNLSGKTRKTLLYNYSQMCMRSYDFETVPALIERCTPRQRRLLGDLGYEFRPGSYFYAPPDQVDVIEHGSA